DDAMHVQDVAFLSGIEAGTRPTRRPHAALHVGEVRVVLFGDLAPVAIMPIFEEPRGRRGLVVAGRTPLEHPRVLDRTIGIAAVGPHPEEDRARGIDRSD